MSSCSGSNSSSRKKGRPPNNKIREAEDSLIKKLRRTYGITKDIKIELKRCDAKQLNGTKRIYLQSSIVDVDGAIPSPSSSLSSYSPRLLRHGINGIIKPKLKSKKLENNGMAPGAEISSPRSSKRLQKNANPSSNGVAVEKGNSSNLSSGASSSSSSQVSPKMKLSRYPQRLRSTRSRSGSTDTDGLPVEENSKSVESIVISKARKIKKKIMESELSSPTKVPRRPPTKVPPPPSNEAEIPSPTKVPRRLPTKVPPPPPSEAEIPSPTKVPRRRPTKVPPPPPSEAEIPSPTKVPRRPPTKVPPPPSNEAEIPSPTKVPRRRPTKVPLPLPSEAEIPSPTKVLRRRPTKVPPPPPSEAEIPSPTEVPPSPPSEIETPPPTEIPLPLPSEAEAHSPTEVPPSPPSEAEIPSPTQGPSRKKKRRLPVPFHSGSNSTNAIEIMEEDNVPLPPPPTTAVSNGLHIDPDMMGSNPPSSPPPAIVSPKRKRGKVLRSRSVTPSEEQDDVINISTDDDDDSSDLKIIELNPDNSFLQKDFPTPTARVAYYCCVMWDLKVLNELQCHEDAHHQLFAAKSIGKLLSESLISEGHTFPGVAHMDWKRKFILLDIISADFRIFGPQTCLRVQEKASIDTIKQPHSRPPKWDLVIHPQCLNIGEEMVRMHRSGVKTTVAIWGAHVSDYDRRWDDSIGELFLKPSKSDREPLSVIIFHHEILPHERFRLIQDAEQGSELWPNFQNPELNHRLFSQADLVHMENPTHFTLHAEKLHNPEDYKVIFNNDNIMEEMEDDEVNEFPEVNDSCDEEDFEMEDDEFSLFSESPDVDDLDDLESASCLGVGSAGGNVSSPDVQVSVSQDMVEVAARIFQRSRSVPAEITSPSRGDVHNSPRRNERRTSNPDNGESEGVRGSGGDQGGAGAAEMESNFRVVSDSQEKFLLTQEVVESDDEDEVDNGNGPNEMEQTVLTCDEDFVTGDEGSSPAKSSAGTGTKAKKGSNQTNICNGHGPPKGKANLNQNGKATSKDVVKSVNGNGSDNPPPSNSEHSEYNFSALLKEF